MLAVFVKIQIKPEYRDQYLEASMGDAMGSTRDEPGCYRFDVLKDDKDQNRIYFYEVYKDEAAFAVHQTMPHFKKWQETVADWNAQPLEVVILTTIYPDDEAWARQG